MTYFSKKPKVRGTWALLLLAASVAPWGANAQTASSGDTGIDSSGDYRQERAWCMANTVDVARFDCLKNSAAAQVERRRNTLDTNGSNYRANAIMRCDVFEGEDRAICQSRVLGLGKISGSVLNGGIFREIETVVPPAGEGRTSLEPGVQRPLRVIPTVRP